MPKKTAVQQKEPLVRWQGGFGWASVFVLLAMVVQLTVFIWVSSSYVTSNANKIETLGSQIADYKKGSDDRFTTVRNAITESRTTQNTLTSKLTSVETTLSYFGQQLQYVQSRIDGKPDRK